METRQGKPGAAIKMISDSQVFVKPNDIALVELVLDVREIADVLTIELSPSEGLALVDTQGMQMIRLQPDLPAKIPVKIRASQNGRYYLNIHATLTGSDIALARNFALIVQAGDAHKADEAGALQLQKPAGEQLIVLPAQETISNP